MTQGAGQSISAPPELTGESLQRVSMRMVRIHATDRSTDSPEAATQKNILRQALFDLDRKMGDLGTVYGELATLFNIFDREIEDERKARTS